MEQKGLATLAWEGVARANPLCPLTPFHHFEKEFWPLPVTPSW